MTKAYRSLYSGSSERGNTLIMVALALLVILGLAALAVDLASFYLTRSEAQRAADAAALAGAKIYAQSGCTSSGSSACSGAGVTSQVQSQAVTVGNTNLVGGANPNIQLADVVPDTSRPNDPMVTVTVKRTAANGNAVPTFFGNIFGVSTVDVSASATAEAYNGGNVGAYCAKPWILPNCDPLHSTVQNGSMNSNCPAGVAPFLDPASYGSSNPLISNPGQYSTGVLGEAVTLKPGDPSVAPAPGQFYPITIPPGSAPSVCPSCATSGGGANGGALYENNIECCNTTLLSCGTVSIDNKTGNMQGPTEHGVECLTNESSQSGTGQDTLCGTSVLASGQNAPCNLPFTIYGGSSNPDSALRGNPIKNGASPSLVTVPVYNGASLCSGKSCGGSVQIVGYVQFFLDYVDTPGPNQGNVHATVWNVLPCGPNNGGGGGVVTGGGANAIPIRLIQHP